MTQQVSALKLQSNLTSLVLPQELLAKKIHTYLQNNVQSTRRRLPRVSLVDEK
jgi:hypothetical protein